MKTELRGWLLLALIVSMCIWGVSWSAAKVLAMHGSPLSIAFMRFSFVPIVLAPFMAWRKISFKISRPGHKFLLGSSSFIIIYTLLFFGGLRIGNPGAAGVLVTIMNPIFAYLIGLAVSRIIPTRMEWIGLLVGLVAGSILLNLWGKPGQVLQSGNLIFLLAAFIWAIMSKITSNASRFGHPIAYLFWMHVLVLAMLAPFVDWVEISHLVTLKSALFWGNLLYFGVINSGFATVCYLYTTNQIGAEKASSFIYLVPFTAALAAWLLMEESIASHTIVGGFLGLAAVFIINRESVQRKR